MNFNELNLDEKLLNGIADAGFTTLMPVQEETLAHSLQGKDVSVQSQTGTGKTAAFLITIFQHFQNGGNSRSKQALIVTPTRELAIQIEEEAKLLGGHLNLTIGCFYGGVGYFQQEKLLKQGVDLIVGTPGRLLDFNSQKKLSFKNIGFLVIDEADRMLDMGFFPDIEKIVRRSSSRDKRQTMLFSATLDSRTRELARDFMNRPVSIRIRPDEITVDKVTQVLYHVSNREKINLVLGILKKDMPRNVLIFTNMKRDAEIVAKHLDHNGFECLHISGDLTQNKRLSVLEKFKSGKVPILVATDVAARGLHIDDLEMIINYDLPGDCENYVHRIGRTARAGKSGKAVTLACEKYIYNLEPIETFLNMKIPVAFAADEMYPTSTSQGIRFGLEKGERGRRAQSAGSSRKKRTDWPKRKESRKKPDKGKSFVANPKEKGNGNKKRKSSKKRSPQTPGSSLQDRVAYYKKKYGENFDVQSG